MRTVIAGLVVIVLGLAGVAAYATWSSSGTGTGVASVGTVQSVTVVSATASVDSTLIPGQSADLVVELDNPNSATVNIAAISQGAGTVSVTGGIGACDASAVTVPTQTALSVHVASGTDVVVHIANGAAMSSSAEDGCQGATFEIPISLTVEQP